MADLLFRGETIRTADELPPWALVEFGNAMGDGDVPMTSPQGMRTLFDVFEVLVVEDDWARFRKAARRASEDELVDFIQRVGVELRKFKAAKAKATEPAPAATAVPTAAEPAATINWN